MLGILLAQGQGEHQLAKRGTGANLDIHSIVPQIVDFGNDVVIDCPSQDTWENDQSSAMCLLVKAGLDRKCWRAAAWSMLR